ncbi:aspartate kinase [Candidatus Uhrbacteria bacterium]|nr:aspartate kinase [Candidatus Uhrbacteria bacterium]
MSNLIVQKFGGSSVANLERVHNVAKIVTSEPSVRRILVLSAMSGVTDLLIKASTEAAIGGNYIATFRAVVAKYESLVEGLHQDREHARAALILLSNELKKILEAVAALRFCETRTRDLILSFGERMMCTLMPFFLRELGSTSVYADARQLIVTDNRFGNARVLFDTTGEKLTAWWALQQNVFPVVTGYIAATDDGISTTLDRGGSDYTATIIGGALNADRVEIWTDVDGAMSADPRVVPEARVIATLSFAEAAEMAYFGAKVLHPLTLLPVAQKHVPVVIKNTFRPEVPGTMITDAKKENGGTVKSVATRSGLALLNVEGAALRGQIGAAGRLFTALARADVNVVMISQASSEESICFIVSREQRETARQAVEQEFVHQIESKILSVTLDPEELCIIAAVGDGMIGQPGVSGRLFQALGNAHVNVRAIAQGSSERNISAVIREADRENAVRAVHKEFIQ